MEVYLQKCLASIFASILYLACSKKRQNQNETNVCPFTLKAQVGMISVYRYRELLGCVLLCTVVYMYLQYSTTHDWIISNGYKSVFVHLCFFKDK